MSDAKTRPVAVYKKGSGFLNGIPARDLSAVDWANLSTAQRLIVQESTMYELKIPAAEPVSKKPKKLAKNGGK